MNIGMLVSRIRAEEKLIIQAFEDKGVSFDLIDTRKVNLNLKQRENWQKYDVVLDRCISQSQSMAVLQALCTWGIPCVNPIDVVQLCGDTEERQVLGFAELLELPMVKHSCLPPLPL